MRPHCSEYCTCSHKHITSNIHLVTSSISLCKSSWLLALSKSLAQAYPIADSMTKPPVAAVRRQLVHKLRWHATRGSEEQNPTEISSRLRLRMRHIMGGMQSHMTSMRVRVPHRDPYTHEGISRLLRQALRFSSSSGVLRGKLLRNCLIIWHGHALRRGNTLSEIHPAAAQVPRVALQEAST